MKPTPTTRPRHALRWVLGVGLVFVVVVGMALQVVRSRADERWDSIIPEFRRGWLRVQGPSMPPQRSFPRLNSKALVWHSRETREGNVFRGWRQIHLSGLGFALVLRQERSFFGSSIEARMSTGDSQTAAVVRAILAKVDVELVVEP